jgi:CheY-like chemotaxis protein
LARILVVDDDAVMRRKVRALLESAGHTVFEATDGQEGLARVHEHNPNLVLLDFVMPRMNGFQFCAAIRAIANYRDTDVVLLSARTDKVGERFINRFGVRDAISKPFDDDAMLAVVDHVLRGGGRPGTRPILAVPVAADLPAPATDHLTEARSTAAMSLARMVAEALPDTGLTMDRIAAAIAQHLDDDRTLELIDALADLSANTGGPALLGELSAVPVAEIMQLMSLQRQTGAMEISSAGSQVSVQLRNGKVEIAVARGVRPEFLLGRYLVEEDMVSRQDLELLLRNRTGTRLLGDQLVKLGYITEDDLARVLTRQTSEILYEVLRWREGRFRFRPGLEIPGSAQAGCRLEVSNLVMEGLRQVDEWRLIEREIPDFGAVFERASGQAALYDARDLSYEESTILDLVDGAHTVRDIVDASSMASFTACKILYRLLSVKLVRRADG